MARATIVRAGLEKNVSVRALLVRMASMIAGPRSRLIAVLALVGVVGCSIRSEETSALRDDEPPKAASASVACSPAVLGLVPSRIAPIEVSCPGGYSPRTSFAAQPIAGRFTTMDELTAGFCVVESDREPDLALLEEDAEKIDFETNDVVAFAYDTRTEVAPALYRRGNELWLRITNETCDRHTPELGSIAFLVPKHAEVQQQRCSSTCE